MPPLSADGTMRPPAGARAPAVSVVVTCYNLEGSIGAALDSVLAQTALPRIAEIFAVDDGSGDGSRDVIARRADRDQRIVPVFQPNGGAGSARNAGIARATAAYVAFLDGDDLWHPDKLAVQLAAAERHPEVALFYSDFEWEIDGRRQIVPVRALSPQTPDPLKQMFLKGVTILPSAVLIRRDVLAQTGPFDPAMPTMQDGELWTRIAHRHALCHIPQVLLCKRERAGNLTSRLESREQGRHEISRRVYGLRPDLRRWRGRREAYLAVQSGLARLATGDRAAARRHFLHAIACHAAGAKAWFYALSTLLPGDPSRHIAAGKRLLRALTGRALAH